MSNAKEKIWSWMLKRTPSVLSGYYKILGRSDSAEMKLVQERINKTKSIKNDTANQIQKETIAYIDPTTNNKAAPMVIAEKRVSLPTNTEAVRPQTFNALNVVEKKPVPPKPEPAPKRNVVTPYTEGAISDSVNRQPIYSFVKSILAYPVISFDVFDTLILRPFGNPKDMFYLLQKEFGIIDFYNIRIKAEAKAKDKAQLVKGNREVTINDIYAEVEKMTGLDRKYGAETEFAFEKKLCTANPYMKRVFDVLKGQNKRIIIVSDMYFSSEQIGELLENCGITGYEKIYVSCEHNVNKTNLRLYDVVSKNIREDPKNIIHIGDNYIVDIKNARKAGWNAKHYPQCNEYGNRYNAAYTGMSEIIGACYAGITNGHLLNGIKQFSSAYEYGFLYGGLYVLGYCNWLKKQAEKKGLKKLILLSRDGAIYQKVLKMIAPELETKYFYWSRCPYIRLFAEYDKNDFFDRVIRHRRNDIYPFSVSSILEYLGLDELIPELKKYCFETSDSIVAENIGQFENFFNDNWDKIKEIFRRNEAYRKYLEETIGDASAVGIVDVGWQGSNGLKKLIENVYKIPCKVSCFVCGSKPQAFTGNMTDVLNEDLEVYAFSRFYNREIFDYFAFRNKHTNTGHFELFTQAQCPTFYNLEIDENNKLKYHFGIPEVENYETISEIHSGIYDFSKLYKDFFGEFEYLMNIPGYDAMIPFRHITKGPQFFLTQLGDIVFSRNLIIDFDRPYIETVAEVIKKQEWI